MKKSILLLIISAFSSFMSHSQTVEDWQKQHPEILMIQQVDATEFYLKSLDKKGIKYFVYSGEIKLEELETTFNYSNKTLGNNSSEEKANTIKLWLASNPDVKIISNSYFDSLTESDKEIYRNDNVLILISDDLTYEDIQNYNNKSENTLTH